MPLRSLTPLWSACCCLFVSSMCAAGTIFTASLSGDQEVPPVVSSATGTALLELSDDETTLSYVIDVFGLDIGGIKTETPDDDIVGVHIHAAIAGETGSVVYGIFNPQQDKNDRFININGESGLIRFTGVWDDADVANGAALLADQLMNLREQGLYINVHTTANPGGEIRGQIVPEPATLAWTGLALTVALCFRRRQHRAGFSR